MEINIEVLMVYKMLHWIVVKFLTMSLEGLKNSLMLIFKIQSLVTILY